MPKQQLALLPNLVMRPKLSFTQLHLVHQISLLILYEDSCCVTHGLEMKSQGYHCLPSWTLSHDWYQGRPVIATLRDHHWGGMTVVG